MSRFGLAKCLLQATRRPIANAAHDASQRIGSMRSFSGLPSLRPTLPTSSSSSVFRPTCSPFARLPQPQGATATAEALDLVPKSSITSHPALAGIQIRCGPRPTMSGASRLIRARRHGFLSRIRTAKGRKLLAKRRAKGRKKLSA